MNIIPKKSQKGFSLIELLVVFGIIGILTVIVFASFSQSRASARDAQVKSDKQSIKLAIARYVQFAQGGKYPGTLNNWYCLKITPGGTI